MKTDMELRQEISHAEKVVRHLRKQLRERKRKAHGLPQRKKGMGCRIGDRDDDLKAARGYTDPSSYVRRDGSEKLVGPDYRKRMEELRERSGGQCESLIKEFLGDSDLRYRLVRCPNPARDPDHVVKRSVRRDDRMSNLLHRCGDCHKRKHPEFEVRSGKAGA